MCENPVIMENTLTGNFDKLAVFVCMLTRATVSLSLITIVT